VGDVENAQSAFMPLSVNQLQDLPFEHFVQGRRRLVRQQQLRPTGQGKGHHGSLGHASGELMRICQRARVGICETYFSQQIFRPSLGVPSPEPSMELQRFRQVAADGPSRVEHPFGLLVEHADPTAANAVQVCLAGLRQVQSIQPNRP
jgi:hypothetical protein